MRDSKRNPERIDTLIGEMHDTMKTFDHTVSEINDMLDKLDNISKDMVRIVEDNRPVNPKGIAEYISRVEVSTKNIRSTEEIAVIRRRLIDSLRAHEQLRQYFVRQYMDSVETERYYNG